ncbi:ABC transporter permease [bacterium]|nr:ABC transporter permease [bacterium]
MWTNYIKVALRALFRNRIYTIINLLGLTLGITVCLLIFLYTRHEFSYNQYIPEADHLYRIVSLEEENGVQTEISSEVSSRFADTFNENLPGIEGVTRLVDGVERIRIDQAEYEEENMYVDPNFPTLFRIPMLEGDPATALEARDGAIITDRLAKKLFGEGSAMGRRFEMNTNEGYMTFMVRGITTAPPSNSTFDYDVLTPFVLLQESLASLLNEGWQVTYSESYARLEPMADIATVEAAVANTLSKLEEFVKATGGEDENDSKSYHFQPVTDIHLALDNPNGWPTETSVNGPLILMIIGFGVLLIACINFTTLAIGRSTTRALEVGVRKVMGAHRTQIMRQFWLEIALLTLVAMILGYGAAELLLPAFSTLAERSIVMAFDWSMLLGGLAIWMLVVFAAGSYPAIVMSGFSPINAIRGHLRVGGKARLRQVLVFIQFSMAVALVAITLIMASQLSFIQQKELGYNGDQVIELEVSNLDSTGAIIADRVQLAFKDDPGVLGVTGISCGFDANFWTGLRWADGAGKIYENVHTNCVRPNFLDVMGIQLTSGRNFDPGSVYDREHALIVNQAMVDYMAWDNPIGQAVPGLKETEVIGVVEDFHFSSLHEEIEPLLLQLSPEVLFRQGIGASSPNWFTVQSVLIRLAGDDIAGTLRRLEAAWPDLAPEYGFDVDFVDDQVDGMYREEQRWSTIVRLASFFTIVIAALGLLGLATLEVTQRTKEIGIRKALGAESGHIVLLLTRQITLLVLAGTVVAWPFAWFTMQRWLENFAYRVELSPLLLFAATLIAVAVAWLTVGVLAWRAANNNPVLSLRHE